LKQHLVVFAKQPVMGAVKKRLAKDIGLVRAIRFYRQNLARVLRLLARDSRWQVWLAISPENATPWPGIPANVRIITQGHGDLGDRMDRVMQGLPPGPAAIIGSDIPGVLPRHVDRVFKVLKRDDVVIGPAGDGGYWVIGMKRRPVPQGAFNNVDWSSGREMFQTLGNLSRWNRRWASELHDVDDGDDWREWRRRLT
jgi:rSAM/selenodomain-associated transferase 1